MPLSAYQRPVSSKPTVDFLEALATNEASATVNLKLPTRDVNWFVRAISLVSLENLAWELMLFTSATNLGGTFDTDHFLGVWQFGVLDAGPPASPGYLVTPVGLAADPYYHQYIDGNMMPYWDLDQLVAQNSYANVPLGQGVSNANPNNASLHCRLINRSAASKTAGAPGAVKVTFYLSLQGAQV